MKPWHDKTPASGKSCPPNSSVQCIMICTSNHVLTVSYTPRVYLQELPGIQWDYVLKKILRFIELYLSSTFCKDIDDACSYAHSEIHWNLYYQQILRYIEGCFLKKFLSHWCLLSAENTLGYMFSSNFWETLTYVIKLLLRCIEIDILQPSLGWPREHLF